jgi:pyroglutamyl-peptidase
MKILVTAFEPYGMRTKNTSQEVLIRLGRARSSHEIVKQLLPVDTIKAPLRLIKTLREGDFQAVICLGEASSVRWVQLERLAVNWLDFPIADNAGTQILDQMITPEGPSAYFSSLPIRKLEQLLKDRDIPVRISMSAGKYLCNQVFYTLMNFLDKESKDIPAGFIHLPVYTWHRKEDEADVACGPHDYEQIAGAIDDITTVLVEG